MNKLESAVLKNTQQRIRAFDLLTPMEREQMLVEWNATTTEYPRQQTIPQCFDRQVEQSPDALALHFEDQQYSYRSLQRHANQLAWVLQEKGVGRGTMVGVCLERSAELVIALLAILKAGATYVPLDPSYPEERLLFIVIDSQARVVLTQESLRSLLPAMPSTTQFCCLNDLKDACTYNPFTAPPIENTTQDLAYLIYTSGSTGMPKGVSVPHLGVLRLVFNTNYIALNPSDHVAQASNAAFDAITFELWGALLNGACLVGVPRDVVLSPQHLGLVLEEWQVSVLFLTTAVFNQVAQAVPDAFRWLRVLLFGGEAVDCRWVAAICAQGTPEHLLHVYGPTESTTYATWYEVSGVAQGEVTIPIGRPISNTRAYVLDSWGKLVPVGVVGELYLGGEGLAQGYWQRAELTAERFVPDAWSGEPGGRLYRTGDLVRYREDGAIEFVGRQDGQIKLRGFRIELGEIETVLLQHPLVQQAVVTLREEQETAASDKRLIAYVVPSSQQTRSGSEEREEVQATGSVGPVLSQPAEHIARWQELYAQVYENLEPGSDPMFNRSGWNSSYTGQSLPVEEMRSWLSDTLSGLRRLHARRVLEIGCGTGMLLLPLAPDCVCYDATDFSAHSLAYVHGVMAQNPQRYSAVQLWEREADHFEGWEEYSYDLIILNSVVQYFPDTAYLLRVLQGALRFLAPGGTLFVGDVRSLPLLEGFHLTVQLVQGSAAWNRQQVRRQVQREGQLEEELLIDPALFVALETLDERIGQVRILPKRGSTHNELTQFRYQVLIQLQREPASEKEIALPIDWQEWNTAYGSMEALREALQQERPASLGISQVPSARHAEMKEAQQWLWQEQEPEEQTLGALRLRLNASGKCGVEWETVETVGAELGYQVQVSWARQAEGGSYDLLLVREDEVIRVSERQIALSFPLPTLHPGAASWQKYTNQPLVGQQMRQLVPRLRHYLQERLPDYMVPAHLVVLEHLPVTPNGKIDRRALPDPEGDARLALEVAYVAPRTPVEQRLAEIWQQVLGLTQVGVQDDFFALGGHSLLATQVVARVQSSWQVSVPLRALFANPTIADFAQEVEQALSQTQTARPPVQVRQQIGPLPLSFAQQRLWFLDQLMPLNPFHNVPQALRLNGPLHIQALERSLSEIVRRHESLRTTFAVYEDQPCQVILPPDALPEHLLSIVDLSGLAQEEQETIGVQLAGQEMQHHFDLSRDLMLRACLLRRGEHKQVLLLSMHHIASDGWSMGVFYHELSVLYRAFASGSASPLAPLPVQYADFACWQRDWVQGEVLEQQLNYWRQQLADLPTVNLPTDFARPQVETFRGRHLMRYLPASLVTQLKKLSQQEGVTLFMTLLTAFQVLLLHYCEQEDIVVGAPIANRTRQEMEGLIGFFINTLVLRTDLSGNPSFREVLARVREMTLGAYAHQDIPFERLVGVLQPERHLVYNPLCQVSFQLQNAPSQLLALPDLAIYPFGAENQTTKQDLTLHCVEAGEDLMCVWEYSTDLFTSATIERMHDHFGQVVEQMLSTPDLPIHHLDLLTPVERQQMLVQWNATALEPVVSECFPRRFEAQVQRAPDAIALVFQEEQLTYHMLNQRANQLAHHLQGLGVGPEMLVGVCLERSLDLVVAFLGILKAGGAYLPLDPAYPRKRLALLLEDAQVSLLLTHSSLQEQLPTTTARVLHLDQPSTPLACESACDLDNEILPEHLAYVIYTSGSTGQPKGVLIEQKGLGNLAEEHRRIFGVRPESHVLQFASSSFDASLTEIIMALSWGACLYLAPRESLLPGQPLQEFLQTCAISIATLTPAALTTLEPEQLPAIQTIISGGEACPINLARRWSKHQNFLNGYGPTEATIWSTAVRVSTDSKKVSIGRPIANTQLYLLDAYLQPVPVGVPGELHIGGVGLARGYLNRPELTARQFIAHPFSTRPGARLYKSGDLARYLPDGSIEFLGRVDQQVKLRGMRIEPGEIESVLSQHPAVRESAVLLREERPGEKHLVAYVVPSSLESERQSELATEGRTAPDSTSRMVSSVQEEAVAHWQELYEQTYQQLDLGSDPTFNIQGWNSSYTGLPIPAEQMQGWLAETLSSIRSLHPQRVLEIGCGTGLLLFPLAPDCMSYDATDFSVHSLAYIQKVIEQDPQRYSSVHLWQREASAFEEWERRDYDLIILNSVTQYFPDVAYLLRVLQGALRLLAPGGTLFVGDVRSQPLLESFHVALQLVQGSDSLTRQQMGRQVRHGMQLEEELLVDPTLFVALGQQQQERVEQVRVLPRRGIHNELTQFRYQVLIKLWDQKTEREEPPLPLTWQDWQEDLWSIERLQQVLQQEQPTCLGIGHVPHAGYFEVEEAQQWLWQEQEPEEQTLGALRLRLDQQDRKGLELEELEERCAGLGYRMWVSWARQAGTGSYDMLLVCQDEIAQVSEGQVARAFALLDQPVGKAAWQSYTNQPLVRQRMRQLVPLLHYYLQERLPDYMVPAHLVLLEQFPLTPSGKVDRRALPAPDMAHLGGKQRYLAPRNKLEQQLAVVWQQVLGVERVGIQDNFFALGGDSILSIQILSRMRRAGWPLTTRQMFQHQTIEELAANIARAGADSVLPAEQGLVSGEVPLTPIQCWFFAFDQPDPHHRNLSFLFQTPADVQVDKLAQAWQAVVQQHDALRLRFKRSATGWQQVYGSLPSSSAFQQIDLSGVSIERQQGVLEELANQVQASLDLAEGPLARAVAIHLGQQQAGRFLLVVHHLVVDGVSWRILLEDIQQAYKQVSGRESIQLPAKTNSWQQWARCLEQYAQGPELEQEIAFWVQGTQEPIVSIPLDQADGQNTVASTQSVQTSLLQSETQALLQEVSGVSGIQITEMLLTALMLTLQQWTGQRRQVIHLEGHGREELFAELDISRTVGWFTSLYPVTLELEEGGDVGMALKGIREQMRAIPQRGIGYGIARYLRQNDRQVEALERGVWPQINFNYLGQFDQVLGEAGLFAPAWESSGMITSPRSYREHLIDISGSISGGQLHVVWLYSQQIHRRETIVGLAQEYLEVLRRLIADYRQPGL